MRILIFILCSLWVGDALGGPDTTTLELDSGITLTGVIDSLNSTDHSYDTCDSGYDWKLICLIDGKPFWGVDPGTDLPRNQLIDLYLTINGTKIDLNVEGMYNPNYKNTIRRNQFTIKKFETGYLLSGYFSDGGGAYMAEWKTVKRSSVRTKIARNN